MRKFLTKKVLLILILITLILGAALIFATTKVSDNLNKIFLVLTIIDFIFLTFLIQALGFQSFKPKKIKYPQANYNSEYDYNPLNQDSDDDDENCSHEFMPVDSTGEILACIKCGFIVKRKSNNIFKDK